MSWFALAPTIAIALVLAVAVMLRSEEPRNIGVPKGAHAGAPADPLPTLGTGVRHAGSWLRNARRPVWPIDYRDFNVRVRRGFKLAGLMAIVMAVVVAAQPHPNSMGGVLLLVGTLLLGAILVAFACIASVIHSVILQIMPYRGPMVSTVLGWAIGFGASFLLRANSDLPNRAVIWSALVYGFIIGIMNFSMAHEAAALRVTGSRESAPRRSNH